MSKHASWCDVNDPDPEFRNSQWEAGCTCAGAIEMTEPHPIDNRVPCPVCGGSGIVEVARIQLTKADAEEAGMPEAEGYWYPFQERCQGCSGDGWVLP